MFKKDNVTLENSTYIWILKQIGFHFIITILLFLSANTMMWQVAWYYLILSGCLTLIQAKVMKVDLMIERSRFQITTPKWDKWLYILIYFLGPIMIYVIAGMEHRLLLQSFIPKALQIIAFIFVIVSGGLITWIYSVNPYYACTMRIQYERDHKVIKIGPYKIVRHPGYLGSILFLIATPIALGSLFGLLMSIPFIMSIVLRTYLEDLILTRHFKGYYDYTKQVRYKLLPLIW